jgi:hypothetical protein
MQSILGISEAPYPYAASVARPRALSNGAESRLDNPVARVYQ